MVRTPEEIEKLKAYAWVGVIIIVCCVYIPPCAYETYHAINDPIERNDVIKSPDSVTLVYGANTEHCTEIKNISEYEVTISGTNGNPIYKFDVEYIDENLNTQETVIISPKRIDLNDGDLIIYV